AGPPPTGPLRVPLRPPLEAFPAPDGHDVRPALAPQRARDGLDRRAGPPDRRRRPRVLRHPGAGDVRRVLRRPAARAARLRLLIYRRRGVPQRLLLDPRARPDLLFQPGPRDQPRFPPAWGPARAGPRWG